MSNIIQYNPRDSLLEPLSRDSEGNFFQRPILNPPGWFFRRKERKILKGGSQGGLPPLVFRRRKEIWSGRGVQGSQAAAMPEGGKKKLPEGLGVGGGSTHMNPSGEEGKMEPRGG